MELSIEKLRSPRRRSSSPSGSFDLTSSACSTPFVSAPSSPRYQCYHSAPASPPPSFDFEVECPEGGEAAVPFSWEERPGTPKSTKTTNSVDRLSALGMGFHFSAPVSPQRGEEFERQQQGDGLIDDFEFSSARMSDADSVVSHADELFFQGQILPLKLSGRLSHHKTSSLSITLQLQDFSPRTSDVFSPPRSAQLPSSKPQLKSPPRLSSPVQSPTRSRSPSKLAKVGFPERMRNKSPPRRSLRELLHLGISSGAANLKSDSRSSKSSGTGSRRSGSIKSCGSDSRSSSKSSSSSSQRFSNSRSSSVSSSNGGSVRSSCSSRQVNPVSSREFLQNYSKNYNKPGQDLRRKTFLPYRQGLLGCLGCLTVPSLQRVRDLEY